MKQLAKLLIIVTLFPALSFAQGRRGGFGGGRARGGPVQMDERTALNLFSALLNLSDAQQQQLHTAFDAAVKTGAPIATQMESNKEALFEAVKAGKSDDQIKSMAEQQGSLASQMLALQAQTFSKMWTLLTSDQRSQVDASMYGDIGEFLANAKQPPPPAAGGSLKLQESVPFPPVLSGRLPRLAANESACRRSRGIVMRGVVIGVHCRRQDFS